MKTAHALHRENLILAASLVLLPFIQLGASYYWSVQVLMFLLIASLLSYKDVWKSLTIGGGLVVFVLMMSSLAFQVMFDANQDILRVVRVFLCFTVLLSFLSKKFPIEYFNESTKKIIAVIAFSLLGFSVIQLVLFQAGFLFYFPRELYITNAETLGDELALQFNSVRPSATFGEPSYLGFVALSLYVVVLTKFNDGWIRWATIFALWGAVFVCATFAGVLGLLVITVMYYLKKRGQLKLLLVPALLVLVAFVLIGGNLDFLPDRLSHRISDVVAGDVDASTYSRIVMPFFLVGYTFENYPLGLTTELLVKEVGFSAVDGTDNGFLLLFVNFGFTAFYIYGLILVKVWKRPILGVYLLMAAMFNGTVFGFDKVAVMAMVILLLGDGAVFSSKGSNKVGRVSNTRQAISEN